MSSIITSQPLNSERVSENCRQRQANSFCDMPGKKPMVKTKRAALYKANKGLCKPNPRYQADHGMGEGSMRTCNATAILRKNSFVFVTLAGSVFMPPRRKSNHLWLILVLPSWYSGARLQSPKVAVWIDNLNVSAYHYSCFRSPRRDPPTTKAIPYSYDRPCLTQTATACTLTHLPRRCPGPCSSSS